MKKDTDALFVIPSIITLSYLSVILIIHFILNTVGISVQDAASFGDIIAGFLAPYIGAITIYFVYRAYQKQYASHDLQEKSVNFQALNQLILELDQQKPQIIKIIKILWLDVYGFNHILKAYNPEIGARISIKYLENETDIRDLIAFCKQLNFV